MLPYRVFTQDHVLWSLIACREDMLLYCSILASLFMHIAFSRYAPIQSLHSGPCSKIPHCMPQEFATLLFTHLMSVVNMLLVRLLLLIGYCVTHNDMQWVNHFKYGILHTNSVLRTFSFRYLALYLQLVIRLGGRLYLLLLQHVNHYDVLCFWMWSFCIFF